MMKNDLRRKDRFREGDDWGGLAPLRGAVFGSLMGACLWALGLGMVGLWKIFG